jgi:outer membrane protein assembly factor BamD
MRRLFTTAALGLTLVMIAGCHHNKVTNPIANVNSKQPDKVLFDRAMDAMKKGKYDVARITLQTLINTYPDSEFVARAKLSVADSWYAEGGTAALQQAEMEYTDFQTFFPNMAEAAEAQLKVANIHYKQMEKPDRDFTHAKRAEEAYRTLIQNYPDSKLVPDAKQRLREVQEVLAEREYRIGRFYLLRESWAAAIARLKSLTDSYPLYSKADDALMMLGGAYEREIDTIRASKFEETTKGKMIATLAKEAADSYDRIITRYPVGGRADDARARLQALHLPVPTATAEAIAQNKAEEESRERTGKLAKVIGNFEKKPNTNAATHDVGDPPLVTPEQTGAPDVLQRTNKALFEAAGGGSQNATVEVVGKNGAPAANQATPRSDQQTPEVAPDAAAAGNGSAGAQPAAVQPPANAAPAQPDPNAIPDLAATPGTAAPSQPATPAAQPATPAAQPPATQPSADNPAVAPQQVNDAANADAAAPATSSGKDSSSVKGKKKKKKADISTGITAAPPATPPTTPTPPPNQ